jgi:hypothetical protein
MISKSLEAAGRPESQLEGSRCEDWKFVRAT